MITLVEAASPLDYQVAIVLLKEYAEYIGVDLSFQNFGQEIANLQYQYGRPKGTLYLVVDDEKSVEAVGCFGIRTFKGSICELKRMYLKKAYHGKGIGALMLNEAIQIGKKLGYQKMRLDTLPTMQSAIKLYQKVGFYEIEPYRFNPIEGTKYFEIVL